MQTAVNGKLKGWDEPSRHEPALATPVAGGWLPKTARPSALPREEQDAQVAGAATCQESTAQGTP